MRVPEHVADLRDWALVGLLSACAVLAGVLEVLFIPLYVGSVLVPVVIVFAILGNVLLPLGAHSVVRATGAAVLPFVSWLVPVLVLPLFPRSDGDVLVLGGGAQQWTFYGVVLLGCAAGFGTIVRVTSPARPGPGGR